MFFVSGGYGARRRICPLALMKFRRVREEFRPQLVKIAWHGKPIGLRSGPRHFSRICAKLFVLLASPTGFKPVLPP
jgi:hypothetical protein